MGELDLSIGVLQKIGHRALQYAHRPGRETRRVLTALDSETPRLHADHLHGLVLEKGGEQSDGVAAAADTGHEIIRQLAVRAHYLLAGLAADDGLKIPHHHRVRMGSQYRTQNIMGGADIGGPVPHGLADGVLEGPASRIHSDDLCP